MKSILSLFFLFFCMNIFAQTWTDEQLNLANTAKDISYINQTEKEAILYLNLARLFPKEFVLYELQNYNGTKRYGDYLKESSYKKNLIVQLNKMIAVPVLVFDSTVYESAKCFAKESGESGQVGHERKNCAALKFAECCSYGMNTGKDIAMQWLIDHNISSLGHRIICLDKSYTKIGIATSNHKSWEYCAVANLQR